MTTGSPAAAQSLLDTPARTVQPAATRPPVARAKSARSRPAPVPSVRTVTLVSGEPGSTALDTAYDLTTGLGGEGPRLQAVVGAGGERAITDVLRTRGVDMGILTTADLKQAETEDVGRQVVYIAKLHNVELHALARADIAHLTDLDGKVVNLGEAGSSTQQVARRVLQHLGIRFTEANFGPAEATARMRGAEAEGIAASFFLTGKPGALYAGLAEADGLHFLPVPYEPGLGDIFYPASLGHAEYPALIKGEESVDTVAVAAVLVAFDWAERTDRYRQLAAFTAALFAGFDRLRAPGRHPKWREVNLAAALPEWRRFKPAQQALDERVRQAAGGTGTGTAMAGGGAR
ncbi:TAXI family TRAP transporter solute-binding subunit [Methylobacterium durans]|uniref:TAXI family TRAP transporter solute-binding subunit n=1 Tax=Methylobacterium durans TaxID=2202825 RepID=UPI0013A59C94|nr:TAXI family TRAP transporter solute-binding subunit [Methylobacterium durans]